MASVCRQYRIDYIIGGLHEHADEDRQGHLEQQPSYVVRIKLGFFIRHPVLHREFSRSLSHSKNAVNNCLYIILVFFVEI